MSFGNVELNHAKDGDDKNAAEMVVARGFGSIVRHRSDEERSCVYETLLELEEKAKQVGLCCGVWWGLASWTSPAAVGANSCRLGGC